MRVTDFEAAEPHRYRYPHRASKAPAQTAPTPPAAAPAALTLTDGLGVALTAAAEPDGVRMTVREGHATLGSDDAAAVVSWLRKYTGFAHQVEGELSSRSHGRRDRKGGSVTFRADRLHLVLTPARDGGVDIKVQDGAVFSAGTCADVADALSRFLPGAGPRS